jgi:hypothetical protein
MGQIGNSLKKGNAYLFLKDAFVFGQKGLGSATLGRNE